MREFWWIIICLLMGNAPALAEATSTELAQAAYWNGEYERAIELTAPCTLFECLVLQTEARLARYSLGHSPDPMPELDQIEALANQALALRRQATKPRLALVAVIGYRARNRSLFTGLRKGWAGQGRKLIDEILVLAPEDPWSYAISANWHLEILRRTSTRRARFVGASPAQGLANCAKALQLAPRDATITGQCGLALLAARQKELEAPAIHALQLAASASDHQDIFACLRQDQAARVLSVYAQSGVKLARRLAVTILLVREKSKSATGWPIQCGQSNPLEIAPESGPDIPG
ncbi:MAG: hypothetical protein COA47_15115 [Robiginitomaculum sp.]|nr:MAG: hypothetical protein COA47_15115 [Robiginitomaculum sp.]